MFFQQIRQDTENVYGRRCEVIFSCSHLVIGFDLYGTDGCLSGVEGSLKISFVISFSVDYQNDAF